MKTPHQIRRERTRRRFAAALTVYHQAGRNVETRGKDDPLMAAFARTLFPANLREGPMPSYALTEREVQAEVEMARVGQRRKAGRPAEPQNTNSRVIALLKTHRPTDFRGRFTLARAQKTRIWLERHGIYKSVDSIIKMMGRQKRREAAR